MFGNMGMGEIALIMVVILLLFGAKRIPEIAGSFGKGIREFKKSISDVDRQIKEPDSRMDRLNSTDEARRSEETETERTPKRLIS